MKRYIKSYVTCTTVNVNNTSNSWKIVNIYPFFIFWDSSQICSHKIYPDNFFKFLSSAIGSIYVYRAYNKALKLHICEAKMCSVNILFKMHCYKLMYIILYDFNFYQAYQLGFTEPVQGAYRKTNAELCYVYTCMCYLVSFVLTQSKIGTYILYFCCMNFGISQS